MRLIIAGLIKPFGLDRISYLGIKNEKFDKADQSWINAIYNDCYGIFLPDSNQKVEEVILSFSAFKGKYIKSLPLHHSQRMLVDNDDEYRISLQLYTTYDFTMELLSHGFDVKVIAPESLANELKTIQEKAYRNYE